MLPTVLPWSKYWSLHISLVKSKFFKQFPLSSYGQMINNLDVNLLLNNALLCVDVLYLLFVVIVYLLSLCADASHCYSLMHCLTLGAWSRPVVIVTEAGRKTRLLYPKLPGISYIVQSNFCIFNEKFMFACWDTVNFSYCVII